MTISDFLQRHGASKFRHSEELFLAISEGKCTLTHSPDFQNPQSCSALLSIYTHRQKHLDKFSTPHAVSLIDDVKILVQELEVNSNSLCGLWIFEINPYYTYTIFEAVPSKRVLGCIYAVDARLIDEKTREELWGDVGE